MSAARSVRIVIADKEALFRDAVKAVLERAADLEVVGEATDGFEAVAEVERTRPDLVLMETQLPRCDGIRATGMIMGRGAVCRILILAAEEDPDDLAAVLEAGARGYLTKEDPLEDLIDAIRAVHDGQILVPPRMLGPLLDRLFRIKRDLEEATRRMSRLTRREREVLALLAEGGSNAAIARALVISPQTVRTYVHKVLRKLDVHSRLEAAAFVRLHRIRQELGPRGSVRGLD